jgi:hypothetical protein
MLKEAVMGWKIVQDLVRACPPGETHINSGKPYGVLNGVSVLIVTHTPDGIETRVPQMYAGDRLVVIREEIDCCQPKPLTGQRACY